MYRLFVGKTPLGRQRCGKVNNIKMDLVRVVWVGVDWIRLFQERDKWRAFINMINKPSDSIKF
jgi:hypothetical protein